MSDDRPDREWTPVEDRRRFIETVGAAGVSALAGCVFGGSGGGGDGDDDGNGGGDGGTGSNDGTDAPGVTDTVPPSQNPAMPEDRKRYVVPSGTAETTFDASFSDKTVYVGGDTIDAVVDADMESQTYTLDESKLDRGLREGDVVVISGVALRKVTGVKRSGSEVTVETEAAALNEAIADGKVGWDAEVGFDVEHAVDAETEGGSGMVRPDDDSADVGLPPTDPKVGEDVYFAGVEIEGDDGAVEALETEYTTQGMKWKYSQGGLDYIFEVSASGDQATVSVTVQKVVGNNPKMALSAEGTVGRARSVASAEYSNEELQAMDLQNDEVGGEVTLDIQAAASGEGSIDWEFPGFMFKYVVMAGPVPVTVGYAPKLIGKYIVPAKASATANATFSFNSSIGFEYTGSETNVQADVGKDAIEPEPADSAANIGTPVDLQFGFAFPRLTVSVFEQGLIPFIHTGLTIGSRLTWGPLCKSSYVRFVVQAGYDFEVMGVNFASDKETLYENKMEAKGDSCGES